MLHYDNMSFKQQVPPSLMLKIYGKKFGALHLRRMYLTTINNNSPSFLERKNVADAVANSVQESLKYSLKII